MESILPKKAQAKTLQLLQNHLLQKDLFTLLLEKNPIKPRMPTKIKVGRKRCKELSLKTNETTIGVIHRKS